MRAFGLIRAYKVPTGAMDPALPPGTHLFVENISYRLREPRRGEIVVFSTEGIIPQSPQHYIKRVAGLPGDRVRIDAAGLWINSSLVVLTNSAGPSPYGSVVGSEIEALVQFGLSETIVPEDSYFTLGDNTLNSSDSRMWGFVPAGKIMGRAGLIYWPPGNIGSVR